MEQIRANDFAGSQVVGIAFCLKLAKVCLADYNIFCKTLKYIFNLQHVCKITCDFIIPVYIILKIILHYIMYKQKDTVRDVHVLHIKK